MTRRKRLCLLLAVLTLLLALSACGAQSKLMLATTGMEPTLDLTLPDTISLPDKGRDTVYKSYVDKAYSMALAAALLDMDADTMQTQLAGRLSYDAQTGYIQYYTPTEELTPGDLSEFPTDAQLEQIVRERLKNCARSEQVLKSLSPALQKTFGVDAAQLTPEQAERLAACSPEGRVPATPEQREEAMRQGYEALREQFAAVREAYPSAQLHEELESPMFMRLVMRGVDARSAYELTHLQELRAGAMAYGARRAREELTAAMQAGYLRPRESGMAPAAFGAFAESPEHWSRQTREELKARARRGETVRL